VTVVLDARYDRDTGVGRYVGELQRALRQRGRFRYRFIERSGGGARDVLHVPLRPFGVREQFVLPVTLARARARLLHCPYFLIPIAWLGPLVVTIHDVIPLEYRDSLSSPIARLSYRFLLRIACRRAARVIVPSEATRLALIDRGLVSPSRVEVIPLSLPHGTSVSESNEPSLEGEYILTVSPIKPHKNLATLVSAYALLPRRLRDQFRLAIVGRGDGRHLQNLARGLGVEGRLVMLGRVPDELLGALYASARAVAVPSLSEGFGLPLLEAMAAEVPVVASFAPALVETADGAALHVDARHPETLSAALERVLTDDARPR
jgi:glycosyltransferase involved in cell wall biosynthesis